jgi:hypothetical protein
MRSGVYRDGCPERLNLKKAGKGMMRMGQAPAAVDGRRGFTYSTVIARPKNFKSISLTAKDAVTTAEEGCSAAKTVWVQSYLK